MRNGAATGVIDWSAGGYADRRYDLATARWTLRYNRLEPRAYFPLFLSAYGGSASAEDLICGEALYGLL